MKSKDKIKKLISILEDSKINSLEVSSFWGFLKIKLSKGLPSQTVQSSNDSTLPNAATSTILPKQAIKDDKTSGNASAKAIPDPVNDEPTGYMQKAPLVGTVYLSPKPGEENFINEGGKVKKGETICIVEAMKIFNEIEAEAKGIPFEVSKLDLKHVPRALAAQDIRGFIKLIRNTETDKLIGARVIAPEGGELIQQLSMAIKFGITVKDLAESFYPYLTLGEGIKLAAITFGKDVSKLSCCAS